MLYVWNHNGKMVTSPFFGVKLFAHGKNNQHSSAHTCVYCTVFVLSCSYMAAYQYLNGIITFYEVNYITITFLLRHPDVPQITNMFFII